MPRALVFDAYGTLYDALSAQALCESPWSGKGGKLSQLWRAGRSPGLPARQQRNVAR
jgi:FMN phosphatase YigB (HAD superfamily)